MCVCVCETAPLSPVTPDHPPPSPRLAADLIGGTLRSMVCCMTDCQFNCMSDIVSKDKHMCHRRTGGPRVW